MCLQAYRRIHLPNLSDFEGGQSRPHYTQQSPTIASLPNVLFLNPGSTGAGLRAYNCPDRGQQPLRLTPVSSPPVSFLAQL